MAFDPAIHGLAFCTVPLLRYPRLAYSASAIPALTDEDRRRQGLLDEANERRTQVIADSRREYTENRDVIQGKFPGMTLAKWINSTLQGENLPLLDAAEGNKLGGWMR